MDAQRNKILVFAFVLIFSISCSKTKIIYNYADYFLLSWFESYFELSESQRLDIEEKIDHFFVWHRKSELPKIILFLEEFKVRYVDGMDQEDINWISFELNLFWKRILTYTEEDIVSFSLTINDNQVFETKEKLLEREDDRLIKQSKMTLEELREDILDRIYNILDEWLGGLELNQKEQISTWFKPDPYWVAVKLRNREKFRKDLINLLKSKKMLKENIHSWVADPESHWTDEFKTSIEEKKQEWKTFTLRIDSITLPRQRQKVVARIDQFIIDFKDLTGVEEKYLETKS